MWRKKSRNTGTQACLDQREDEPLQLARLYAGILEKSRGSLGPEALSGPERDFLQAQQCELRLRHSGLAAAASEPAIWETTAALRRMGAQRTADCLETARASHGATQADLSALEEELARHSAAWARNHGWM